MSNVFETIGHGVEVAAKDVARVAEEVVTFLPKAEKVLATAIKDNANVKQAVLTLVSKASTVVGDVAKDTSEKGLSLTDDAQTLSDAEAFFAWFKANFVPVIEAVYAEVKADVTV